MTVMPLEYVDAPPRTPPAYGILSAAVVVDDTSHATAFGFEYDPDFCGRARLGVTACTTAAQKIAESGHNVVTAEPFMVYSLHSCQTLGLEDAQGRASRALQAGEGAAVEEWLGERLAAEADDQAGAWVEPTALDALAAAEH